jgi:acyl-coenzyme A synthetase/AMP-(fatty) acid ligase
LPSPRNSRDSDLSLLKATKCTKFLFATEFRLVVSVLVEEMSQLEARQVPDLEDLLRVPDDICYPSWVNGHIRGHETVMILHSSGTAGAPKPVHLKSGVFRVVAKIRSMPAPEGRQNVYDDVFGTRLLLITVPFFHVYAILMLARSLYYRGKLVLLPSGKPPDSRACAGCHPQDETDSGSLPALNPGGCVQSPTGT